jgi:hypothetical protein
MLWQYSNIHHYLVPKEVRMRKTALIGGLFGVALLLSACSANEPTAPDESAAETSAPAVAEPISDERYGDVICTELVTDEFGEYCHVTIAPEADALVYDGSKTLMDQLTPFGFTEDDAKVAQTRAVTLLVEEVLDSSRLDNYTVSESNYFRDNSAFYDETWRTQFQTSIDGGTKVLQENGIVVTGLLPSPTVRDSGPRANGGITVQVDNIYAQQPEGGVPNLIVRMTSTSVFYLSDEQIVSTILLHNADQTSESLSASSPGLFDGVSESGLLLTATSVLGFGLGSNEQIIGNNSTLAMNTTEGLTVLE